MLPVPLPLSRSHEPLRLGNQARDWSFGKSLEREACAYVDDCNHQELESEAEGEIDDVEDESDRLSRSEEDVSAEGSKANEARNEPG